MYCCGYRLVLNDYKPENVDYSKYLGPKWRENKFKGKHLSTIVANHIAFVDMVSLTVVCMPSFTPAIFCKYLMGGFGDIWCGGLASLYIDRDQGKDGLDNTV